MLILEDELFVELSTTSSMIDAFCLPGAAVVPLAHSTMHRVISGTEKVRK